MTYAKALRERVLDAYSREQVSVEELARRFGVCRATIYNWRCLWQESDSLEPRGVSPGRPAKLDEQGQAELRRLVGEEPGRTLPHLCDKLQEKLGVRLSASTMSRTLRKMGLRSRMPEQSQSRRRPGAGKPWSR